MTGVQTCALPICSAAESKLTQEQWVSLGTTLKHLHSLDIPSTLKQGIPRETFSAQWREALKAILLRVETEVFKDAIALKVVDMLQSKSKLIVNLLHRAESLAISLQKKPMDYVLCHADLHGWNLLIDEREQLYIVDWDTLLFAPKERDVMFVGAAIWDSGHPVAVEEALFYKGYGGDSVDMDAITYYRCERILQDICEYCQAIFSESQEEADKLQSFNYLQSNFLAGGTVEQAFRIY